VEQLKSIRRTRRSRLFLPWPAIHYQSIKSNTINYTSNVSKGVLLVFVTLLNRDKRENKDKKKNPPAARQQLRRRRRAEDNSGHT
jgi:hypothetical protein